MTANPKPDAVTADHLRKLAALARPCDCDHGCSHDSAYAEIDNMGGWKAIAMGLLEEADELRAELAEARGSAQSDRAVGFAAGIEAAARIILDEIDLARIAMPSAAPILCADLRSIRALTPPDITAAAARVLLADMENITAKPLANMVEAMLVEMHPAIALRGLCAALRAIAEVEP